MASRALKQCRYPGCPELTRDGYCPRHKRQARKASAEWHSWYSKPIWTQRLRPGQLMREPWCRECARSGVRTRATVADHVVPFRGSWALFTDEGNLQSLCKPCHDRKTMREQGERPGF